MIKYEYCTENFSVLRCIYLCSIYYKPFKKKQAGAKICASLDALRAFYDHRSGFPEFFLQLSSAIGIVEPVNMIFLLQGAFLLCICISLSVIVSGLNRKLRALIQDHALLEKRVRDLEKQMQEEK